MYVQKTINIVFVYILGSCHITMRNVISSQPSQHHTMSATDCTNRRYTSPIQRTWTEYCRRCPISCPLFLCLLSNERIFEPITVSSSSLVNSIRLSLSTTGALSPRFYFILQKLPHRFSSSSHTQRIMCRFHSRHMHKSHLVHQNTIAIGL